MDKLDMESLNVVDENIDKIGSIFPNVIVESEKGKSIDFDLLKQELSNVIIEGNKEKYQLTWPGKKEAILNANTPTSNTIRPLKEKSVNFDTTENIYIEGDNLEVLKILQESYLNKIKCIYIDPPYNTGNDFIYNDNFAKNSNDELVESGQLDEVGNRLVTNNQSNGRYHSDWLSMIYPRLKLARNLLTDNGLIFISIDDNELFNLKKICDEIFGENNFINCISIKMSELSGVKMKHLNKYPKLKESLLIYSKNSVNSSLIIEKKRKNEETLSSYLKYYSYVVENKEDNISNWKITPLTNYFAKNKLVIDEADINNWKINNADKLVYRTNSKTVDNYIKNNPDAPEITEITNNDGNKIVKWKDKEMLFLEKYIFEYLGDIWTDISTINLNKEIEINVFENGQKPLFLIKRILNALDDNKAIILDFFSGSATTAHAVMQLNAEDNGNRKYIMVQLLEETNEKSEAYKTGYKNICEIGQERIRRAAKKIKEETYADIDYGFRVYKLDSSNMKDVYYTAGEYSQNQLNLFESNIKEDRTSEDLLTQVMLDLGLKLDLKIDEKELKNNKIYFVEENSLVACFDDNFNIDNIDEICKVKPLKLVFKDSCFKTDNDKINVSERIKKLSPETEISVI